MGNKVAQIFEQVSTIKCRQHVASQYNHECRNFLENLHKLLARTSSALNTKTLFSGIYYLKTLLTLQYILNLFK